jgi:hypothetical protein
MYKILGADQKEYGPAPAEVIRRWIRERRLEARSQIRRDGETGWRTLREFPEFASDLASGPTLAGASGASGASSGTPGIPNTPGIPGAPSSGPSSTPSAIPSTGSAGAPAIGSSLSSSPVAAPSGRPASAVGGAGAGAGGPTLGGGRKTHGAAVAALIIGILSPCTGGLAGIIGIIVGAVALRRIRRSNGRLAGRGHAVAGIVLSIVFLLLTPLVILMAFVANQRAHIMGMGGGYNAVNECLAHEQQLAEAVRRHANDNNDRYPNASGWCDAIQPAVAGLTTFQCPSRPDLRSGYAINVAVAGRSKFEVPGETVLLFEADGGWNSSGGVGAALARPRHGSLITVILADGNVRQVSPEALSTLRWNP